MLKPEWLVLFGAISELALLLLVRDMRRALRRAGARRPAFVLDAIALLMAAASPFLYYALAGHPYWIAVPFYLPVAVLAWSPRPVVWVTGGPDAIHGIARACSDLDKRWRRIVAVDEVTDRDERWLKSWSQKLERWRAPETSELIDSYQARLADALLDFEGSPEQFEAKEAVWNSRKDSLWEQLVARSARR